MMTLRYHSLVSAKEIICNAEVQKCQKSPQKPRVATKMSTPGKGGLWSDFHMKPSFTGGGDTEKLAETSLFTGRLLSRF